MTRARGAMSRSDLWGHGQICGLCRLSWLSLSLALIACGGQSTPTVPVPVSMVVPTRTPAPTAPPLPTPTRAPTVVAGPLPATGRLPPSHVFVVAMGTREATDVIGNAEAPYINQVASQAALASQYYAIRHPSLPNYLALIGGHTFNVDSECTDCLQDQPNLTDAIEAHGKNWKSYQEDLPTPCFLGTASSQYTVRHNPFLYFKDIRDDPVRCNRVVPLTQLDADLSSGDLPDFLWITPNLVHDMHDGSVAQGDQWLAGMIPKILNSDAYRRNGLLIVTWSEGSSNNACCGVGNGGNVPLIVATPTGPRGYVSTAPATHYHLLRTIEDLWGLDRLGNADDPSVRPLWDMLTGVPVSNL